MRGRYHVTLLITDFASGESSSASGVGSPNVTSKPSPPGWPRVLNIQTDGGAVGRHLIAGGHYRSRHGGVHLGKQNPPVGLAVKWPAEVLARLDYRLSVAILDLQQAQSERVIETVVVCLVESFSRKGGHGDFSLIG